MTTSIIGTNLKRNTFSQVTSGVTLTSGTDSIATNTFTDISGVTTTITPSASTSKILILYSVCANYISGSNPRWRTRLVKDGAPIAVGDTTGSRVSCTTEVDSGIRNAPQLTSFSYLDAPGDTSAHTYKVQYCHAEAGTDILSYNKGETDADLATNQRGISSIIAIELKA